MSDPKPGDVTIEGVETFGPMPVKQELEILPADPAKPAVGWMVSVMSGTEVFKADAPDALITVRGGLQPGDSVLVQTLVGTYRMTVKRDEDGTLYADAGHTIAFLEFDTDDRHCWTSPGAANTRGLKRLTLQR